MNPYIVILENFLQKMKEHPDFKDQLKFNKVIVDGNICNWTPLIIHERSKICLAHDSKDEEFTLRVNLPDMAYGNTIFRKEYESSESVGDWVQKCLEMLHEDLVNFKNFQENHPFLQSSQVSFSGFEIKSGWLKLHVEKICGVRKSPNGFFVMVSKGKRTIQRVEKTNSFGTIFKNVLASLSLDELMMLNEEVRDIL